MKVILFELRKIFEWKRILALIVLNILLINSPFVDFMAIQEQDLTLFREMVEIYGLTVNLEDIQDFAKTLVISIEDFDAYLEARPGLADLGITTFEEFQQHLYNWEFLLAMNHSPFFVQRMVNIPEDFDARLFIIHHWHYAQHQGNDIGYLSFIVGQGSFSRMGTRAQEVYTRPDQYLFPGIITRFYRGNMSGMAFLAIANVMILLMPLSIKERKNQMFSFQYTSKLGRKLFLSKIAAAMITSTIVVFAKIAILFTFLIPIFQLRVFLPMNVNSAFGALMWYDLTFLQYIMLTSALVYLIALLLSIFTALLSRLSPNLLTVLAVIIPFILFMNTSFYLTIMTTDSIFPWTIGWLDDWVTRYNPSFFIPSLHALNIVVVVSLLAILWRREKKLDITI